ncbi:MAG: ATP-binding protein [Alphaproteobacteria bacterium]|nr:ATP-binding protein [Alphaproteobacteria bacterium]
MYVHRTLESTLIKASASFPVVMVTGPRQIGKTTFLQHCAKNDRRYVTLDDFNERALAVADPELFFKRNPPPILIDEVQYAPELFSYIKIICDKERKPGLFWLTGSQKFHLMKNISESLAGRVAILDLLGLSQAEIFKSPWAQAPVLPTSEWIELSREHAVKECTLMDLYKRIWSGSFPQIALDSTVDRDLFYSSYIQTYIQRDVKNIANITSESGFFTFLKAAAARTGQLLNYADLARDADISQKSVKDWLSILETSGIIYLLRPYHNNVVNRLVKTPKLYFLDTGLCSYLTRWQSPESLEAGAMSGAILETYVVSEILKSYWHNGKQAYFNFYRDKDGKEVDLIIDQNNTLYPIEIKKTANPLKNAPKNFGFLQNLKQNIGQGMVVCLTDKDYPLSRDINAVPIGYL